jgi:hypothetical protein
MATHGARDQGDQALILALLQGKSLSEAARASGLSERTVSRRLGNPDFQGQLNEARRRVLARAVNLLVDGALAASTQLRLLATTATQESIRLAAARSVLEYAFKGIEFADLVQEIAELREQVQQVVADRDQAVGGGKRWRRLA